MVLEREFVRPLIFKAIGIADEEAVIICFRNNMLNKLYALAKIFNKMIGRRVVLYNFKIVIKVST